MTEHILIRPESYHDSVVLMRVSQALESYEGVADAVVAMGTPHNKELLEGLGFSAAALGEAGPNDLVVAFKSDSVSPADVETRVDELLASQAPVSQGPERPSSLDAAVRAQPETNLVLISVPGEYAAREARRALVLDRHVMIFSDNVSLDDEVKLKRMGRERGLLVMGPDCGTALIGGAPLGFANALRRGSIGLVAASGTGLQEVTSCIHRQGGGVSQAIGTGGRDLSEAVGAITTLMGIQALAADAATEVIVVISKPPAPAVAERVIEALGEVDKPAIVHFVGAAPRDPDVDLDRGRDIVFADTLADAAHIACHVVGGTPVEDPGVDRELMARLAGELKRDTPLVGLFCGGTTGQEALVIIERAGHAVHSNLHKSGPRRATGTESLEGHVLFDLGADELTRGRPHPMIEPDLRNEKMVAGLQGVDSALLLFDLVLGYGAHPDPAGVLIEGLAEAREVAAGPLVAIASVTGTPADPQNATQQRRALEEAGVVVLDDNSQAARLAAAVLSALEPPQEMS